MCAPMALGLIGAAVSAVGTMASAQAQANNAKYNAAVERVNERARYREGLHESVNIGDKYDRVEGTQQAGTAAGGMDPFYGSAMDIFTETKEERGRAQTTNATNYTSKAISHENKAAQYDMQAKDYMRSGAIGAMATFLGGLRGAVGSGSGGGFGATLGSGSIAANYS